MKVGKLAEDLNFGETKPAITVLFETENTKEIRILMKKGQEMKEHKTPYPITVEVFHGIIKFGVNGEKHRFMSGDLLALEGNVPHDLVALEDSIVRLTLSKSDKVERVLSVVRE